MKAIWCWTSWFTMHRLYLEFKRVKAQTLHIGSHQNKLTEAIGNLGFPFFVLKNWNESDMFNNENAIKYYSQG